MRRLFDGVIDLAFLLDPPQMDSLRAAYCEFAIGSGFQSTWHARPEDAVSKDFLMVDWGLAHALELRRAYPDMPEPFTRLANTRTALSYMRQLVGSAYMPHPMVTGRIRRGKLHRVQGAREFICSAYAVYPMRSEREPLINETLQLFSKVARGRTR